MDAPVYIAAMQFCLHHEIELVFLQSLSDHGLIVLKEEESGYFLEAGEIGELEKLVRLHRDLHINPEGLAVIQDLQQTIYDLKRQLVQLKAKLQQVEQYL